MNALSATCRRSGRRIRYRVGQFSRGFVAHVGETELAEARRLLPPAAYNLFAAMPADAQRHSLNVLYSLAGNGPIHADLAVAALLHDVGKLAATAVGTPIRLWLRGLFVMAGALAPEFLSRYARRAPPRGHRFAAWVYREHPTIGAFWACDAGCTQGACLLVALHQTHVPEDAGSGEMITLLRALQQADNEN